MSSSSPSFHHHYQHHHLSSSSHHHVIATLTFPSRSISTAAAAEPSPAAASRLLDTELHALFSKLLRLRGPTDLRTTGE
jgi:hypothetical protein